MKMRWAKRKVCQPQSKHAARTNTPVRVASKKLRIKLQKAWTLSGPLALPPGTS